MKLIKHGNVISLGASLEVREQRYLKHLASALSHYLENPHGSELVFRLGSGYEKNNRQTLDSWVSYHRDEIFAQRLEGQNPLDCNMGNGHREVLAEAKNTKISE